MQGGNVRIHLNIAQKKLTISEEWPKTIHTEKENTWLISKPWLTVLSCLVLFVSVNILQLHFCKTLLDPHEEVPNILQKPQKEVFPNCFL